MNADINFLIKFKQGDFEYLRMRLLEDLSKEFFAILLGRMQKIDGYTIITVFEMLFPDPLDYNSQKISFLDIKKGFIHRTLTELTHRHDADTLIDVHTHPFSLSNVSFSITDDTDEERFFQFLQETFDGINYASIVLSQHQYSARVWTLLDEHIGPHCALIKTQTNLENIPSSDIPADAGKGYEEDSLTESGGFFNRAVLALGLDTMRKIMDDQVITIVGIGGLGSIIAEHLIHSGFQYINLIDPDTLEVSNLNRIVGAYYQDAAQRQYKVDVVKRHLANINPRAAISAHKKDIYDAEMEQVLALTDWILVATDTHSSRFKAQELSVKYFVPLISVGVNITVRNGKIEDMSGEVITARVGDYLCLNCLHRINPSKVASETHPDRLIREELKARGYVGGEDVKEPAVKTLNAFVATMAVEVLLNQYTGLKKHAAILVYESSQYMMIYEDKESVRRRNKNCFTCNI